MRVPLPLASLVLLAAPLALPRAAQDPIIIDHRAADVTVIPAAAIDAAKANLHIAYGHTSHGSQVTDGMSGLVGFTGGVGGPQFAWNNGGTGGALDLHDYAMGGDVGYWPQWVNNTTGYLDDPANADCNVIIWSWCGQVSGHSEQSLIDKYLDPMDQLEQAYPGVTFVYMTGHLDYWSMANTNARNQQIRDYCITNGKVLYDFADIESYDPDGTWYPFANDDCEYWDAGGTSQGNWAINWQNAHVSGVDWYPCSSAHSQPLNANQKAYAVWQLWARLGGWAGVPLTSDHRRISAATGATVEFFLEAGATNAGRTYLMVGSANGTEPGVPLPGGLVTLPLNYDWFANYVLVNLNTPLFGNFLGTLDAAGSASATLDTGGPLDLSLVGLELNFAYTLLAPLDTVSNATPITITG